MLFETSKGAVPASAFFNQNSIQLVGGKGAGKLKAEKSLASERVKKQFSFIVDADDKNCFAELTVALKLNHGVRQWLYIIAGVLFFRSFFCTSKRKNIKHRPGGSYFRHPYIAQLNTPVVYLLK